MAFLGPWVAIIAAHLNRSEGRISPSALLPMGLGALLVIEFLVLMITDFVGGCLCVDAKTGVLARDGFRPSRLRLGTFGGWPSHVCIAMHQSLSRYFTRHPDGADLPTTGIHVQAELAELRAAVGVLQSAQHLST